MLPAISSSPPSPVPRADPLRQAAAALEVNFLSEMLAAAGLGEARDSFGGGVGEDQFASFLRRAQAERMVAARGIGLAEHLFAALAKGGRHDR